MLCVSMSSIVAGVTLHSINADVVKDALPPVPEEMRIIKETVDKYVGMDEYLYEKQTTNQDPTVEPLPVLGGGEIFGLWITIEYNGQTYSKQVSITLQEIRGKLTDPQYRTPIKFDVDGDTDYDIETGFGFFRYGIDEYLENGNVVNHAAWATAFDFRQIGNLLDDQMGELEVWQEFHVNLAAIKNSGNNQQVTSSSSSPVVQQNAMTSSPLVRVINLINRHRATVGLAPLTTPLNNIVANEELESIDVEPINPAVPLPASEDYIVTRVGYRSRAGEKIPIQFEKTFAVDRGGIFRPAIFQHEMDPNDVIGTASMDVLFGFQAFKQGDINPTYNIEFNVSFEPACYVVTQLTPLSGRAFFYYHTASAEPTDITFSSNLLSGGSTSEEENATFSLTLSLDDVPGELVGPGKYMAFDLHVIGDSSPLGGHFTYWANQKFNIGLVLDSPWFEEKLEVKGVPDKAVFSWGVDAELDIVQGEMLDAAIEGFVDLTMSSSLDDIILYYPKADPDSPDVTCFKVSDIPSSRELRAGASLSIDNASMLKIDIGGFVSHTMSSQLGDITLYWPKADPYNPDAVMVYVPANSFSQSGRTQADATLYVDSNPDNFWINDQNYFRGKVERTASSDFGRINFYLPNIEIPILEVYNVPGDALGRGQFWWNQLEADIYANRQSSSGQKDPIKLNLVFSDLILSNELRIGNGHIDMAGKIAEDGYFELDTSNDMLNNTFEISNLATEHGLRIDAGTISAENFEANWDLDTSGQQAVIDELSLTGKLSAFRNFGIDIEYDGDIINFDGDWAMGDSGAFEIDFYQSEPIHLDFDLDDYNENIDLHGYVEIDNDLHFDVSWKWESGSYTDPAYFKINENSNQANVEEVNLYFAYQDNWGAEITLYNLTLYVSVEWYWDYGNLYIWPVFSPLISSLDLHLLLNGVWYYNVEDNWP